MKKPDFLYNDTVKTIVNLLYYTIGVILIYSLIWLQFHLSTLFINLLLLPIYISIRIILTLYKKKRKLSGFIEVFLLFLCPLGSALFFIIKIFGYSEFQNITHNLDEMKTETKEHINSISFNNTYSKYDKYLKINWGISQWT